MLDSKNLKSEKLEYRKEDHDGPLEVLGFDDGINFRETELGNQKKLLIEVRNNSFEPIKELLVKVSSEIFTLIERESTKIEENCSVELFSGSCFMSHTL